MADIMNYMSQTQSQPQTRSDGLVIKKPRASRIGLNSQLIQRHEVFDILKSSLSDYSAVERVSGRVSQLYINSPKNLFFKGLAF